MKSFKSILDQSPVTSGKENNNFISHDETINSVGEAPAIVSAPQNEDAMMKPHRSGERLEHSNDQNDQNEDFSEAEMHQIEREHEPFLMFGESGNLQRVSELDLAVLYQNHRLIVFLPQENRFYLYGSQTGLWKKFSYEYLEKDLTDFSNKFFNTMSLLAAFPKLGHQTMLKVIAVLKTRVSDEKFFEHPEVEALHWFHYANCMVEFNIESKSWDVKPFSPKYRSRKSYACKYDPTVVARRFLDELVNPAMNADDIAIVQQYAGQCLLGPNRTEKFLVMTGTPGGGKTTLVNVIKKMIGLEKCAELRLQHSNGRFEVSHYVGKNLLIGSDVPSDFLNRKGSERLKSYVGKDQLNYEYKCSKEHGEITGEFNIIITSNTTLQVRLENDPGAWARRMLWTRFENPPPANPITDFDDLLIKEEASGIANWMMEGAAKVILNEGHITSLPAQQERVNLLLEETNPVQIFVRDYIVKDEASDMTMKELWNDFNSIREGRDLPALKRASFNKILSDVMDVQLKCIPRNDIVRSQGYQRGFRGVRFKPASVIR